VRVTFKGTNAAGENPKKKELGRGRKRGVKSAFEKKDGCRRKIVSRAGIQRKRGTAARTRKVCRKRVGLLSKPRLAACTRSTQAKRGRKEIEHLSRNANTRVGPGSEHRGGNCGSLGSDPVDVRSQINEKTWCTRCVAMKRWPTGFHVL